MTHTSDPVDNLDQLATFIAHHVASAMRASYVTFMAGAWFDQFADAHEKAKRFQTHPANTLTYRAFDALEEQSIVSVVETLLDKAKLFPHGIEIRRLKDLRCHRHAISHPMTVKWDRPWMQDFADRGRQGYDWRVAQLWDLQRSINEELRKHGRETHNETITVTREMAMSVHMILDLARQPTVAVPDVERIFKHMQREIAVYQATLDKHPDGMRDTEEEEARKERRRVLKEHWAAEKAAANASTTDKGDDASDP